MPTPALQTADDLRRVAQLLSDTADAYNARLKTEAPHLDSGQVFARLNEEQRLRSIANQLHFEAAERTLSGGVDEQSQLESTLRQAQDKLNRFKQFATALDLFADLLVLGGAILAGKPKTILAALKEVRRDVKAG